MAMIHGGQLSRVATQFNIPEQKWIDLSTGIAPFSYPIPTIPEQSWQDLPTIKSSLIDAAKHYYQAEFCWPVAGSQQLIEKLPALWNEKINVLGKLEKHVYLPEVGYKEHQQAWFMAGYQLHFYQEHLPSNIEKSSVVVVINPNNPLTDTFSTQQLMKLQQECEQRQALLVIDEAFADIFTSEFSFVPHLKHTKNSDVIVLRSFGKFFGLAGLRIGFVCSTQGWCETVKESIGPWSINGPALYITELALSDSVWQQKQLQRLNLHSKLMLELLSKYFPGKKMKANALFVTVFIDDAASIYQLLCEQAIYVRLTNEKNALRFGLANESQLAQLSTRLSMISDT